MNWTTSVTPKSLLTRRGFQHLIVLASILGFIWGCDATNQTAVASPTDPKTETPAPSVKNGSENADTQKKVPEQTNSSPTNGTEPVQEKEVSPDIYPNLPVKLLNPEQRSALLRVTKAQLCPCPNATTSMHQCLQKKETQCGLAAQSALEAMRRINDGLNERDVLDEMGKFIEGAYKKYTFNLENTPYIGDPKAPVVIVEFADFECPFCNFARSIIKDVLKSQGDQVVFYFKQYPLPMHAMATPAAMASLAAHKQGKFWPMYDLLFDNQKDLTDAKILEFAQMLNINMERFKADLKSPELAAQVAADRTDGENASVDSTPSFFINGRKFLGEKTSADMTRAVKNAIK